MRLGTQDDAGRYSVPLFFRSLLQGFVAEQGTDLFRAIVAVNEPGQVPEARSVPKDAAEYKAVFMGNSGLVAGFQFRS